MIRKRMSSAAAILALFLATTASAQFRMRGPQFRGVWSPVVGSGGAYLIENKDERKTEMELAVVGSESVDGKSAYWLETTMKQPREGQMVMKQLVVLEGKETEIKRMIMQRGDDPPMEMPIEMMMRGGRTNQAADVREEAERVGSESVTTPAGTFTCEHYRLKDGSGDVWIAEKVSPYGLVKMVSRDSSMTLTRVVSDAKSKIQGTPQKFDPMEMMRRRPPE